MSRSPAPSPPGCASRAAACPACGTRVLSPQSGSQADDVSIDWRSDTAERPAVRFPMDADEAGERGAWTLRRRAEAQGILVGELVPREDDFNRDLCHLGPRDLALHLAPQLDPNDAVAHLLFDEGAEAAAT